MKFKVQIMAIGLSLLSMASCKDNKQADSACCKNDQAAASKTEAPAKYAKKYTNADYYTDGKFNQAVALAAYKDMFAFYGIPFTPLMEKDFWVAEFNIGDFENVGMGGIFWVNDPVHLYFGHEIYLLPGQMIPEHAHVKTKFAPKFESWLVQKGMCYNFSAVGDETPNPPALPASQKGHITSKNFTVQNAGELLHLKKIETFHFLMAGPEGAVVSEYGSYHDGAGLRFTNPVCKL